MFLSKYGEARHVYVPIIKRAVVDFAVGADWTPAAGDVKISKDGGAAANVTNLPTAIAMGNTAMWDFSLTATEMQAAQVKVTVADAATKVVEDTMFILETYGNASAQHAFDLDASSVTASSTEILPEPETFYVPANSSFPVMFETVVDGASATMSSFAVTDIEIYKDGNVTQRSSDAGITLLDTDGTDFDGITGAHGFKIDLSDNTDAGFYAVGSIYNVWISTVTVNGKTRSFQACKFRIMSEENPTGVPDVNVIAWNGASVTAPNVAGVPLVDVGYFDGVSTISSGGRPAVNATHLDGSAVSQSGGVINANMAQVSGDATAADALETMLDGTGGGTLTADLGGSVAGIDGVAFPTNLELLVIDEAGIVEANIVETNDVTITGDGSGTPFDVV